MSLTMRSSETRLIAEIKRNGFQDYMGTIGIGSQNKLESPLNDRKLADGLQPFITN